MALAHGIFSPEADGVLTRRGRLDDVEAAGRLLAAFRMSALPSPPTYVVEDMAGEIVAIGSVFDTSQGFGLLANVAVSEHRRRQGLGKKVVAACLTLAQRAALPEVWLTTFFWNRRFYEGLGFDFVPSKVVPEHVRSIRTNPKCLFMRAHMTTPPTVRSGARRVVLPRTSRA